MKTSVFRCLTLWCLAEQLSLVIQLFKEVYWLYLHV